MPAKHQTKESRAVSLLRKNQSSSLVLPRRGITPSLLPPIDTGLDTCNAIQGGPNVETEHGAAVGERRSGVVVDDISELFACLWTVDDPVVSIEWWLGAILGEFGRQ